MTTAYTSLLGLALPVQGELTGVWGDTVNNSITSLLDTSVAGTTNVSTDTDVTLTTTTGAANTARQAILLFSGARTALRTVTAPAQSKIYTVINATTGGFSVKLVGVGPTTGLTIPNGASAVVAWNGSDFVEVGAGSIGNLVVNGTLTVTGATTLQSTLAVTGNITNTAGTANGVAYLNGSKVVTSGSALTFDTARLSFIKASNSRAWSPDADDLLAIENSTSANFDMRTSTTGGSYVMFSDTDARARGYVAYLHSSDQMPFAVAGSEQMRLTSTGLGIGTSSPVSPLTVAGTASVNWAGGASSTGTATIGTQGTGGSLLVQTPSVNTSYASGFGVDGTYSDGKSVINLKALGTSSGGPYSADMAFFTSTNTTLSEKMRLNSSGNLGLGVTPSAWRSVDRVMQAGSGVSQFGHFVSGGVGAVYGGGFYRDDSGFKYTLTATPAGRFDFNYTTSGGFTWNIAPTGTAGNAITFTQAMTLDASGQLLLGTTTNRLGEKLHVLGNGIVTSSAENTNMGLFGTFGSSNLIIGAFSNLPVEFRQNNTERARIDSSGNLLVGTTSSSLTSGNGIKLNADNRLSVVNDGGVEGFIYYNSAASAYRFYVSGSGTISATNTTISAISDIRFKENVRDLDVGLNAVMALKPRLYDWKEGKGANIKNARGFIAQEFEEVFPDLIDEWKDPAPEGEAPYKSVRQDLIPVLVKAIQEQQAIIESLKARLDAANL